MRQFELQPQDEIRVFLFREQVSTAAAGAINHAVLDAVTVSLFAEEPPAVETFAVEQRNKSSLLWRRNASRQKTGGQCRRESGKIFRARRFHQAMNSIAANETVEAS